MREQESETGKEEKPVEGGDSWSPCGHLSSSATGSSLRILTETTAELSCQRRGD